MGRERREKGNATQGEYIIWGGWLNSGGNLLGWGMLLKKLWSSPKGGLV